VHFFLNRIRSFIFFLIRISGVPFLIRITIQRKLVTILYYHDIDPKVADISFKVLRSRYNIISLDSFINAYISGNKKNIPSRALIITFDDGHKGNFRLLPVINECQIPVTIFLCAGIINTNRHYWWTAISENKVFEKLLRCSNVKRLEILSDFGFRQDREYQDRQALLTTEINEMKTCPYISFGSHTIFHPFLDRCSSSESLFELSESKRILEQDHSLKIKALSFPNGNYSNREIKFVESLKYQCALTVNPGYNSLNGDVYRLRRFSTNDTSDMNELIVKASGLWRFITYSFNAML